MMTDVGVLVGQPAEGRPSVGHSQARQIRYSIIGRVYGCTDVRMESRFLIMTA